MSVVSVKYDRSLVPATALEPGEWTDQTASGRPAVACVKCHGIYEVPETHRIETDGFVVPALHCGVTGCDEFGYIRLVDFSEEVLR